VNPDLQKQIDEIWASHRAAMIRADRADRRMDRAEKKAQAADQAWRERMDRAEARGERLDQRMEKFDRQIQTTRKLVQAGMKIVAGLAADTRALQRSQKAFLDSLRNSGNGHGRTR